MNEDATEQQEQQADVVSENGNEIIDELERDFQAFNKTQSTHTVEQDAQDVEDGSPEIDLSDAENFKLQIFLSLMFGLLDGLHVFVYKFISKYKLTREDIALDESDKAGLEIYFKTKKVMDLINRLPVEVIGFLHIEYMYFNKFQEFSKKQKELEQEQEEQEEPEDSIDEKITEKFEELKKQMELSKPEKKAAPKKATKKAAKKKPAKKQAE